jgi:hypothetical protein
MNSKLAVMRLLDHKTELMEFLIGLLFCYRTHSTRAWRISPPWAKTTCVSIDWVVDLSSGKDTDNLI